MDTIAPTTLYTEQSISNTARQNAKSSLITLGNVMVEAVSVLFPAGHNGLTSLHINYGGITLVPWNGVGANVLGNAERLTYDIGMYMPGPITVVTNNSDGIAHTLYLTWRWHYWKPSNVAPGGGDLPLIVA